MTSDNSRETNFASGALALYKQTPAVISSTGEKIELTFPDGKVKRVRLKDIRILHPGPVKSIKNVMEAESEFDLNEAWELLQGESASLADLTELVVGESTPENVWAIFREIRASDCFSLDDDLITPLPPEVVEAKRAKKLERERTEREWREHIERLSEGAWDERDLPRLKELESYVCGQSQSCRVLKELKIPSTPEKAHELLLRLGVWNEFVNPHPARAGQPLSDPDIPLSPLPEEERLDLTHLASFAIDDDGCRDPDDAVSLDGDSIWIHVADPAALASPDSPVDLEARDRGSNAYLPEKTVKMLPEGMTRIFGLGLSETSPALSFELKINDSGIPVCGRAVLSVISAEMISYEQVESLLGEEPFARLAEIADANRARRESGGAFTLGLPEIKTAAVFADGAHPLEKELTVEGRNDVPVEMRISRYPELKSRGIVSELMVMAGEAVGRYLAERGVPVPFAGQPAPEEPMEEGGALSAAFACRKRLRRTQLHTTPARHAGLGLDVYVRTTSPLRRYSDLLAHQQIRALIKNERTISEEEMLKRMSQGESGAQKATLAERRSVSHWIMVELKRRQTDGSANFTGIVVEAMDDRRRVILPELAMDALLRHSGDSRLDEEVELTLANADIPALHAIWRLSKRTSVS